MSPRLTRPLDHPSWRPMGMMPMSEYDWYEGTVPIQDALGPYATEWRSDEPREWVHDHPSDEARRRWAEWLAEEAEDENRKEGVAWIRRKWVRIPTLEPIEVTYEGDVLSIWDGHHRLAAALEAGLSDVPAYIGIPKAALRPNAAAPDDVDVEVGFPRNPPRPGFVRLQVCEDGQTVTVATANLAVGNDVVRIQWTEVSEDYRNRGYGRRLYEEVFREAAKRGLAVESDTRRSEAAEHIWQSLADRGLAEGLGHGGTRLVPKRMGRSFATPKFRESGSWPFLLWRAEDPGAALALSENPSPTTRIEVRDRSSNQNAIDLAAYVDGELAGNITASPVQLGDDTAWSVDSIYVLAEFRRTGVGQALWEKAAEAAEALGSRLASIYRTSQWADAFWYKQVQADNVDVLPHAGPTGQDAYLLRPRRPLANNPMSEPLVLYTGTQVWESRPEIRPAPGNRVEHGPGLYFTTSLETARKYGRGSRTVLRVEVDPDFTWLEDATVPLDALVDWVRHRPRLRHKTEIVADLEERAGRGLPEGMARPAALVNLMRHYEATRGDHGPALAEFLTSLGIGASSCQMSGDEEWVVLFDPQLVLGWRRVTDEDPWMLPSVRGRE